MRRLALAAIIWLASAGFFVAAAGTGWVREITIGDEI